MKVFKHLPLASLLVLLPFLAPADPGASTNHPPFMSEILSNSTPADWRPLDPENTLYMELTSGRVIIELAPQFASNHVAHVKELARQHYYDGLQIVRVQDNYVVQWADFNAENARPHGLDQWGIPDRTLPAEFDTPLNPNLPFTPLPDPDLYAPEVGFSDGFPVARDPASGRQWLIHEYAMVGAGRDNDPNSGGPSEIYAVIGHAPRQLDRNVTLFGRVVRGIELLSSLPRGTGPLGFYEKFDQTIPIKSIRVAADVPAADRTDLQILRTDTPAFRALIESRRNRHEPWFHYQAGHIDIANVPLPARLNPAPKSP